MRDQLVGYMLGALDADEHERVERKLAEDTHLQGHLHLVTKWAMQWEKR